MNLLPHFKREREREREKREQLLLLASVTASIVDKENEQKEYIEAKPHWHSPLGEKETQNVKWTRVLKQEGNESTEAESVQAKEPRKREGPKGDKRKQQLKSLSFSHAISFLSVCTGH